MNLVRKLIHGKRVSQLLENGLEQLKEENYYSAITYFSHVLELDAENEVALMHRAKSYFYVNSLEKASRDLDTIDSQNVQEKVQFFYLCSKVYLQKNDFQKASEYASKYLKKRKNDIPAYYFVARIKYLNNEYEEAIELTNYIIESEVEDLSVHYLRSLVFFELNDFTNALAEIEMAIKIDCSVDYLYNFKGLINIQINDFKEAKINFESAIKLRPANPVYYFNKAKICLITGDFSEASESIKSAMELEPSDSSYHILNAKINFSSGNISEAVKLYEKVLDIEGPNNEIIKIIGELYFMLGNYDSSIKYFNILSANNISSYLVYFRLAQLNFIKGNRDSASEYLDKCLEINPEFFQGQYERIMLQIEAGKYDEALKIIEEIAKNDDSITLKFLRLITYLQLNKYNAANAELNKIDSAQWTNEHFIIDSYLKSMNNNIEEAEKSLLLVNKNPSNRNQINFLHNIFRVKLNKYSEVFEMDRSAISGNATLTEDIYLFNRIRPFLKKDDNHSFNELLTDPNISVKAKERLKTIID